MPMRSRTQLSSSYNPKEHCVRCEKPRQLLPWKGSKSKRRSSTRTEHSVDLEVPSKSNTLSLTAPPDDPPSGDIPYASNRSASFQWQHTVKRRKPPMVLGILFSVLLLMSQPLVTGFVLHPSSRLGHMTNNKQDGGYHKPNSAAPSNAYKATMSSSSTILLCQLLGMNCAQATEFALSWPSFCERGGATDIHADGWGLAYYSHTGGGRDSASSSLSSSSSGQGLCAFHDVEPASTSRLAAFLGQQPIETRNMLAHIRYATSGAVDLANVHPFTREMWAMNWCFCHNGQVPLFDDHPETWLGGKASSIDTGGGNGYTDQRYYYPIGSTDSEAAFCAILNALRAEFPRHMPSLPVLYEKIQSLCQEIVEYDKKGTILNFLLTCGPHVLWVYSWPGKRPGSKVWNGLHYSVRSQSTNLSDSDYSVDVSMSKDPINASDEGLLENPKETAVCIVATKPLTDDEEWIELKPGELILLDEGKPHVSPQDLFRVELHGHGLNNDGKVLKPVRLEEDMRRYQFEKDFFAGGGI